MIVDWIIRRARRTPYYHLAGYMERFWLVPFGTPVLRDVGELRPAPGGWSRWTFDGTGPVSPWRRPIARLLQLCGIAVRVHHILRSDRGRDPHDHPWPYLTVILRGGYYEKRYDAEGLLQSMRWHGAGSVLFRPADSWHMLHLPEGTTTWTLFITGPKAQTWGFNVDGKKVPYREYLKGHEQ